MSLGHPKVDMRLDVGESHAPCLSCVDRVALLRARVNVAERQTHCRKTDTLQKDRHTAERQTTRVTMI